MDKPFLHSPETIEKAAISDADMKQFGMADEIYDKKNKPNMALINNFTEIGWPDPFPGLDISAKIPPSTNPKDIKILRRKSMLKR